MRTLTRFAVGTCVLFAAACGDMKLSTTIDPINAAEVESVNVVNCSSTYALSVFRRTFGANEPPVHIGHVGSLYPDDPQCDGAAVLNVDLGDPGAMRELVLVFYTLNSAYLCNSDNWEDSAGCRESHFFESTDNGKIGIAQFN